MEEPTTDLFERDVFSVSELNAQVKSLLESNFAFIWVEGEISNIARPASGHLYFSLKDERAQVRCAMFRMRSRGLDFKPDNGTQVVARARVSLYPDRGDYQLIVEHLEEAGDGKLQRAFEALKKTLGDEGLFANAHKKPLPTLPNQIGIITSSSGAAVRDVLSVLKRRFPAIPVVIYPTQVQGATAHQHIVNAIQLANARKECDVLILTRGGGSLEDLWSFNEEAVARAIFASECPIVNAVGHEIDFTIADFVADLRAPTPSAAAELVTPDQNEWLNQFTQKQSRLTHRMQHILHHQSHVLSSLQKRLRHPGQRIQEQQQRLDYFEQSLIRIQQHVLDSKSQRVKQLSRALDAVSPLATLDRGYSLITLEDGTVLHSSKQVKVGDKVNVRLSDGKIDCIVQ